MRNNKSRKILVTGGCGYIGSHTIIELIRKGGYEVISIDNLSNSNLDTIDRIYKITGTKVKNYVLDLRDYEASKKVFMENPDLIGVVNFAALKSVPESVSNPLYYYDNNINSLINILKCCEEFKVKAHIFSSSCSVYGNVKTLPVTEDTPLSDAESPYAHTKQIGEAILQNFSKNSALNTIALRYFNPVGADSTGLIGESPKNRPNNLVPVITQTAVGMIEKMHVFGSDYKTRDGSCIRDYIHVSDIAIAHIKALDYVLEDKNINNFEIFNLGSGEGITVLEAIKAFEKISGVKLKYEIVGRRAGDVESIYSNCYKAESLLGWKPKYNIEQMMQTAWKWQQNLIG
ncbi:MAG: UDP-glucose 4-epimerase GalE [Cytophagaceae bacterium]